MRMAFRFVQVAALTALAACGTAPSATQAQPAGDRPFKIDEVATFDAPWAMAFLPGSGVPLTGMALVTEKGGKLWLLDSGSGQRQEIAGVPAVKVAGQGGLGDVVARLESLGQYRVYLSYVEAGPIGTSGAALGYGFLKPRESQPRLEGFRVIWRQTPKVSGGGHFGHRIAFAPDGSIYISSGDRQKMTPAQDRNSDLGKIVHLTAEGQPIGGRYITLGHRNPLGIAFAPDGRLWEIEMGPKGGDEVNLITPGKNYGWPEASYGSHYDGKDIPDDHRGRGFEEPKVWWNPSISPGGLLIYTGDLFPQWQGDALIGALSGEAFIRVDINGDQARTAEAWPMGARIRAVDQGPKGEVYLLEDGPGARLLRLTPRR